MASHSLHYYWNGLLLEHSKALSGVIVPFCAVCLLLSCVFGHSQSIGIHKHHSLSSVCIPILLPFLSYTLLLSPFSYPPLKTCTEDLLSLLALTYSLAKYFWPIHFLWAVEKQVIYSVSSYTQGRVATFCNALKKVPVTLSVCPCFN